MLRIPAYSASERVRERESNLREIEKIYMKQFANLFCEFVNLTDCRFVWNCISFEDPVIYAERINLWLRG